MVGDGKQLKYGMIMGTGVGYPVNIASGVAFKAASGRFVTLGASGATVTVATDAEILGFVDAAGDETLTAITKYACIIDLGAIFRIPVNAGTFTAAMVGKTCDLTVAAGIQGADLTASARDVVKIVGGDLVNNAWVDVVMNPAKVAVTGVA